MRHYLNRLRARGELITVSREVEARHEAAAVARRLQRETHRPVLFEKVRGHDMPVLMNLYSDHQRLREIIRCGVDETFCARLDREIAVAATLERPVEPTEAPDDWISGALSDLPILTYHARDGAPYITSGIFLAKDPDSGVPNLSFHRSMVVSDSELRVRLGSSHDLARYQQRAEARGEALEAAILIGAAPELFMSACVSLPPDGDEIALAAAMRGGPIAMRRAHTLDLDIPVSAEIVIEGRILPHVRRPEGPFGEFMGYYVEVGDNHVFEISHVG